MIKATNTTTKKINTKYDGKLKVYPNGVDNLYPETVEYLKNQSVTALMASNLMVQYLIGKGLGGYDLLEVYDQKVQNIFRQIAKSVTDFSGCYVQFYYNANFKIAGFEVLPFNTCRIGKKDSNDYNGKILYSKDWSDTKVKPISYNVFNNDVEVVKYQMNVKDTDTEDEITKKVLNFGGQIQFFTQMPEYHYPISRLHAALNDCIVDASGSLYVERLMDGGFLPRTLLVTRPLVDDRMFIESVENPTSESAVLYRKAQSEYEDYKQTMQGTVGVKNANGILTMEVDFKGDKLEDALLVRNLDTNIKPDLFEAQVLKSQEKILMAYNNLPIILVKASESLFNAGGEAIKTAKQFFWESTTFERMFCEQIINDCLNLVETIIVDKPIEVLPLFVESKSQNELAKSVGGVQALLQIVQQVTDRLLDYNATVAIVKELYGIDEVTAKSFLGTPNF